MPDAGRESGLSADRPEKRLRIPVLSDAAHSAGEHAAAGGGQASPGTMEAYRERMARVSRVPVVVEADLLGEPVRRTPMTPELATALREIPLDLSEAVRARMRHAAFDVAIEFASEPLR